MSTLAASVPTAAISLYFREGSSDKVYHAQIVPNGDDLYAVNFQYGRRGSTLQTGAKTAVPVALAEARKIFNKLVTEKKAKGYTEGERGVLYSGGELANCRFRGQAIVRKRACLLYKMLLPAFVLFCFPAGQDSGTIVITLCRRVLLKSSTCTALHGT